MWVTELLIYVFVVFIGIIGGTPDKRIPEGLFLRLSTKNRVSSMFVEFL